MKTRLLSGLLLASVMFMCGASYAGTFTNDGILAVAPTGTVSVYTVDPPLVPAAKPDNSGIGAGSSGLLSIANFYQLKITDNAIPRTVLACGYSDIPKDKPYKIPIAV